MITQIKAIFFAVLILCSTCVANDAGIYTGLTQAAYKKDFVRLCSILSSIDCNQLSGSEKEQYVNFLEPIIKELEKTQVDISRIQRILPELLGGMGLIGFVAGIELAQLQSIKNSALLRKYTELNSIRGCCYPMLAASVLFYIYGRYAMNSELKSHHKKFLTYQNVIESFLNNIKQKAQQETV